MVWDYRGNFVLIKDSEHKNNQMISRIVARPLGTWQHCIELSEFKIQSMGSEQQYQRWTATEVFAWTY